ncbi:MAG: aldehyde dehydrogenase [Candidatus Ventricola sp.]
MNIESTVAAQRAYFLTGETLDVAFRKDALRKLRETILSREAQINDALAQDLGKSPSESYMCEVGMTLSELSYTLAHVDRWARRQSVLTPLAQFHAHSFTVHNPYGVVLIMSPWNYPFMLTMEPLIGALAAGNCALLKPSAYAPATSAVIREIVSACFPPEYVAVVEGGRKENQELLNQRFDYIFFTGGVTVGKEVMRKAAEHLTPVSLELGGKSPCIVDATAKLDLAAKRIAFGKLLNCGQTCVAPDYLLIDRRVKDEFIALLKKHLLAMAGGDALSNAQYVHMINRKHYDRVMGLIDPAKVVLGGQGDPETLRIAPTILDNVTADDAVMQEEIFGPVLPVIAVDSIDEAVDFIRSREHPLALYLFSEDKRTQERFLRSVPFGGGCINDTIIHLATSRMGFGGVGHSGMGSYHGRKSFETFSHEKSIVDKSTWMDMPVRYMPYSSLKDKLLRMFLR